MKNHIENQFMKKKLGALLEECKGLSGQKREDCIDFAVALAMKEVEKIFIAILGKLNWRLVWMGIEG